MAVVRPGFLAGWREAVEAMGMGGREGCLGAGGGSVTLIPGLRESAACIDLLETRARRELAGWL